jgi:hypothetical protein
MGIHGECPVGIYCAEQEQFNNITAAARAVKAYRPAFAGIHHVNHAPALDVSRQRVPLSLDDL